MTAKHTPGPWFVEAGSEWQTTNAFGSTHSITVVDQYGDVGLSDESVAKVFATNAEVASANARLIAAAPELLEALQVMLGTAGEDMTPAQRLPIMEKARAAIRKATGETE